MLEREIDTLEAAEQYRHALSVQLGEARYQTSEKDKGVVNRWWREAGQAAFPLIYDTGASE